MIRRNRLSTYLLFAFMASLLTLGMTSCSTTSAIPEGDQLFVGLTKIEYSEHDNSDHFTTTREEMDAALATAPNGALFGSSYYRTPFPIGLWIWNAFSGSESGFSKWMTKSFGKKPVLMSWVNPELRASVGQQVLRAHGYFRGNVDYEVVQQHNPKKAKIGYKVNMGHLFTIDSLQYLHFPPVADSLIQANAKDALIHNGDPFSASTLEAERTRIANLLRNNGFFYYQPSYASYLADTINVPGKALLHFQLASDVPQNALRKWTIGKVDLQLRRQFMEQLKDSFRRRDLTVHFNGRKSPIRPRVILKDLKLRPNELYSYEKYIESTNKLSSMGLFSMVDFKFTPRDTTDSCNILDLDLNCVFDRKYDFYVETNLRGKTNGALGPELVLGLTKRNAFRGGETFDINMNGSYEWQTGHAADGTSSRVHSYEYGLDASLEMPRLVLPFWRRHRFYTTPSTIIKASMNIINRKQYFKRHVVSGELTYRFQTSSTSAHEFSPIILQYEYMTNKTEAFEEVLRTSPYLMLSMANQFVPKMRYTYSYSSPLTCRNPIFWQVSLSEAANLLSLGYMAGGKKWSEKQKHLLGNPYAQFLKVETDFRKTWQISENSELVAHAAAGVIWSYGNSESAPYSEQFYVGGANSIRAFNVRSIGPGAYYTNEAKMSYLDQTGDIKLLANIEYRPRLFGNLYGAIFLDAGNIWALRDDGYRENSKLSLSNLPQQIALGTGIGLRYDLDFFVIRVDWGIALHTPYKSGFYNISSFKDGQCLHFAIGYPF